MATLSGAERIRAITDEDGMFKAFDTYPWKRDKMFTSGLYAILGDPNTENPQGTPTDLAIHARIFYYAQRIGVTIDFAKYKDWLAKHPDHTPPDVLPEEYKTSSTASTQGAAASSSTAPVASEAAESSTDDVPTLTSKLDNLNTNEITPAVPASTDSSKNPADEATPSWQAAAPKADLYVERKAQPQEGAPGQGGDEPAYPMGFAQMLEMIQKGIPIPGIRQIPDTVVRDASVKPFGKRAVPKKPWEKDIVTAEAVEKPSVVDSEFPPLDDDVLPAAEAESVSKEA
ncbi:hypothetical protein HER10_EVM0000903 [Colletotrichum scovillei]|uniref:Uncharacterized protein n=1 Tax=Colletotrichum scovillei TaxID=1209932 RepID=A0A9P7RCL9_9PEZI|nr:uncharacterized protein HER10_EVM0000903 [Colletotrichum scovillei]KAF4775805.1 hypothetical protein HER10_EVM0000903 [Colletotrichum scovillei]KAG7054072.1 hypothetical protein JMJ77_0001145 [Colletotrichum scovillei]KAG7072369.1 hypothetical protein JMJ76_0005222 [Colletotrichum scovillei]KAG7080581.1 hypothetical protein JMJ78_0007671 [Colletotrichum scovillei]